jgi:hypothetical protein
MHHMHSNQPDAVREGRGGGGGHTHLGHLVQIKTRPGKVPTTMPLYGHLVHMHSHFEVILIIRNFNTIILAILAATWA